MINLQKDLIIQSMLLEPTCEKNAKDESRQIAKANILQKAKMNTWLKQIGSEGYEFSDIYCFLP